MARARAHTRTNRIESNYTLLAAFVKMSHITRAPCNTHSIQSDNKWSVHCPPATRWRRRWRRSKNKLNDRKSLITDSIKTRRNGRARKKREMKNCASLNSITSQNDFFFPQSQAPYKFVSISATHVRCDDNRSCFIIFIFNCFFRLLFSRCLCWLAGAASHSCRTLARQFDRAKIYVWNEAKLSILIDPYCSHATKYI